MCQATLGQTRRSDERLWQDYETQTEEVGSIASRRRPVRLPESRGNANMQLDNWRIPTAVWQIQITTLYILFWYFSSNRLDLEWQTEFTTLQGTWPERFLCNTVFWLYCAMINLDVGLRLGGLSRFRAYQEIIHPCNYSLLYAVS